MKGAGGLGRRVGALRGHLTQLNRQPLSRAALTIVLLLDAFVLSSIFDGLDRHTGQLTRPDERIPPVCREIVLERSWNPSQRLERLGERTGPRPGSAVRADWHPLCAPLLQALDAVRAQPDLRRQFDDIRALRREGADLRRQVERIKGSYDTALLKELARPAAPAAPSAALGRELDGKTGALDAVTARLAEREAAVQAQPQVQALWQRIDAITVAEREQLRADLDRLQRWYPVRRLGMELVFLLPLLGLFYAWNAASLRRQRPVQTLVSSHLLVVAFIPVLCKLLQLLYDILPRQFLQRLMALLESLHLVALWNYLAIALAIGGSLVLIYVVQTKLFAPVRLAARRIGRGQCQDCGQRLPPDSAACPQCGFLQFTPCRHCGQTTHVRGPFCRVCGQPTA